MLGFLSFLFLYYFLFIYTFIFILLKRNDGCQDQIQEIIYEKRAFNNPLIGSESAKLTTNRCMHCSENFTLKKMSIKTMMLKGVNFEIVQLCLIDIFFSLFLLAVRRRYLFS